MTDSIETVLDQSEVVIIGNGAPEFKAALDRKENGPLLIDLMRITNDPNQLSSENYQGICW